MHRLFTKITHATRLLRRLRLSIDYFLVQVQAINDVMIVCAVGCGYGPNYFTMSLSY